VCTCSLSLLNCHCQSIESAEGRRLLTDRAMPGSHRPAGSRHNCGELSQPEHALPPAQLTSCQQRQRFMLRVIKYFSGSAAPLTDCLLVWLQLLVLLTVLPPCPLLLGPLPAEVTQHCWGCSAGGLRLVVTKCSCCMSICCSWTLLGGPAAQGPKQPARAAQPCCAAYHPCVCHLLAALGQTQVRQGSMRAGYEPRNH